MKSNWKAILGVILIFVLGFISGVVGSSIFVSHKIASFLRQPAVVAEAALEKRLTRNLKLDENQKVQIHDFFLKNLQSRREFNKQIQPEIRMANLETFRKINATLRPDQQEIFRKNLEEMRNRFRKVAADTGEDNLPPTGASETAPAPQR